MKVDPEASQQKLTLTMFQINILQEKILLCIQGKEEKKDKSKSSNPSSTEEPVLSKLPQCLATRLEYSLISQVVLYWQNRGSSGEQWIFKPLAPVENIFRGQKNFDPLTNLWPIISFIAVFLPLSPSLPLPPHSLLPVFFLSFCTFAFLIFIWPYLFNSTNYWQGKWSDSKEI